MATKKTSTAKKAVKKAASKKPAVKKSSVKEKLKKPAKSEIKVETNETKKITPKKVEIQSQSETKDMPKISIKFPDIQELLKAGVQFGHKTKRMNPKMADYIFSKRWDINIIDVNKTLENLEKALNFLGKAAFEGNVLFVGTKRQGAEIIENEAKRAGAFFIVNRWPGGLLTNLDL